MSDTPTPDLAALVARVRDLDARATPGPWEANGSGREVFGPNVLIADIQTYGRWCEDDSNPPWSDCVFIAESRTLLPALADAVERLTAENERLRRERDGGQA